LLRPRLVIPVGKLAIEQLEPEVKQLTEIVGVQRRSSYSAPPPAVLRTRSSPGLRSYDGMPFDLIALPHPSGASTWHRTEPGKTLLVRALALIAQHDAWQALLAAEREAAAPVHSHA
jgi:uracil-DNA glycosylase